MRERIPRLAGPWFIALVALLLRAAFLAYKAYLIPAQVLAVVPFQNEVGSVAEALSQGHGFCCLFRQPTGPTAWLAPVYALLLAGVFKLLGAFTLRSFCAAVLLNCVFSALACIPLFHAGNRVGGASVAAMAAWLWAFFPSGIILPFEWIWDTSLSVFLSAALLWATLFLSDSSRRRDFALYGGLWGLALLTNPVLGSLLPFLLGWLLYQRKGGLLQQSQRILLCISVIVLACLPWTIRNYVQFHRFIPLRSNFPFEFWSGNNEIFDEHSREVNRITRYEQVHLYAKLGENAFLEEKGQKARNFVVTHPALYAQLCGRRILATWFGSGSPWLDFLHTDSVLGRFLIAWNALVLLGVAAGSVRLYLGKSPDFVPLVCFPMVFPLAFYLTHTSLRHRHPVDPILALLTAIAIAGVGSGFPRNKVDS